MKQSDPGKSLDPILQLHVVFSLAHAVQAGIPGPQTTRSKLLVHPQELEKVVEVLLPRRSRLKIESREIIFELGPHPPVLLPAVVCKLGEFLFIRDNGRHANKERC